MLLAEKLVLTAEEYLKGEETADCKHEYLNGAVWAMAGASDAHVTIAGNLFVLLKQSLKGTPCRPYIFDMKVNVAKANAFFYPDVFVSCDRSDRDISHYKQNPLFIAEVLSPSTEAYDRGQKFSIYRQLDSLQTFWLIDSQALSLDCYNRTGDDEWLLHSYYAADDTIVIPPLKLEWKLHELYEDAFTATGQVES